jgi:hypothetical protein
MEYYKYINEKSITDYQTLVTDLTTNFNLKFKEEGDLFLIYQDNDETNYNEVALVRNCIGLIGVKETLKVVCYSFDRCFEVEDNTDTIHPQIDINNIRVEKAYEGSLIRVYFYNNCWYVSTKRCIDASKAYWISNKSFYELFTEVLPVNFKFTDLDESYCYSFLLCHPDNNIINKNYSCKVYHLSTRHVDTLSYVDIDIGITKPYVYTNIDSSNINTIFDQYSNEFEGYMLSDINGNRQKVEGKVFKRLRLLWGNTNNRIYRYLQLRKSETDLKDYLSFFFNDCTFFKNIELLIIKYCKKIHKMYLDKNVKKTGEFLNYPYSKITYKLHGDYLNNRANKKNTPVTVTKVMNYINQLDVNQLYHYLNIYLHDKENHSNELYKYNSYINSYYNVNNTYEENYPILNGDWNNDQMVSLQDDQMISLQDDQMISLPDDQMVGLQDDQMISLDTPILVTNIETN